MKINLTSGGIDFLAQCMDGGPSPVFEKITYGNGENAGKEATQLSNPLVDVEISACEVKDKFIELTTVMDNSSLLLEDAGITNGFRATELGVFITDPKNEGEPILFAYGYDELEDATYIPTATAYPFETTDVIMVYIGDTENVSAILNESMTFVTKDYFENHTNDKENPHEVTKNQVGLGFVPNVTTNDQLPTFTVAEKEEKLESGKDTMSVLMGKLAKIVETVIAHISNKKNPHELTAGDINAASKKHNHKASDMTSGILSVERGGTGVSSYGHLITKIGPYIGSYKGNTSRLGLIAGKQFIKLGFTPSAVLIISSKGQMTDSDVGTRGGLVLNGKNLLSPKVSSANYEKYMKEWNDTYVAAMIVSDGFYVNTTGIAGYAETNNEDEYYYYIAYRQGE